MGIANSVWPHFVPVGPWRFKVRFGGLGIFSLHWVLSMLWKGPGARGRENFNPLARLVQELAPLGQGVFKKQVLAFFAHSLFNFFLVHPHEGNCGNSRSSMGAFPSALRKKPNSRAASAQELRRILRPTLPVEPFWGF